ncbi:MAG: hypothetical protein KTR17_10210 [Cellvibrionaceae bacterium]|nr:hypothetical protein [Cellvibrionaceae bacterium]
MNKPTSFTPYMQTISKNNDHRENLDVETDVGSPAPCVLTTSNNQPGLSNNVTSACRSVRKYFARLLGSLVLLIPTSAFAAHIIGEDSSNTDNPFVQPVDPALSGGNRNQTLNNGDFLLGTRNDDILEGRLGIDVLNGLGGDDILIGGLEHFTDTDQRTDRAFGVQGNDIFLWKPGDGTDFFDGGSGIDIVILGIVGEPTPGNENVPEFRVLNDNQAGIVFIDPQTRLPLVDVSNSPGFCPIVDESSEIVDANGRVVNAAAALRELDIDHLAQFVLRGVRNNFEDGQQNNDNGLRVSLHLKNVEFVVCASRDGTAIELIDLRSSPVVRGSINDIRSRDLRRRLNLIVQ